MRIYTLLAVLLTAGCAHQPITLPDGPGGAVAYVTSTGVVFKQQGYDLWISEGVPASYFVNVGKGRWYTSNLQYHEGNKIRVKKANP